MYLVLSLILSVLSLLTPAAFAAEMPVQSTSGSTNIIEVRRAEAPTGQIMAVVLNCLPVTGEMGKKFGYIEQDYGTASARLAAALSARRDIGTLVLLRNPTASEVEAWLKATALDLSGNKYQEVLVAASCPAHGGDTEEEILLTREAITASDGLPFSTLTGGMGRLAESSFWLLDASRDVAAAVGDSTYGPTADDVVATGLPAAFAISSGPPGRYAKGGLLEAAATAIEKSGGAPLSLGEFYYRGIKPLVPELDTYTSLGAVPGDVWNPEKFVLPGEPKIIETPPVTAPPTVTKKDWKLPQKLPPYTLIGAGGVALSAGGIFAARAVEPHRALARCAAEGCDQTELTAATANFVGNRNAAFILGSIGVGAVGGGTWWLLAGDHQKDTTVAFNNHGVTVTGSF